MEETAAPGSDSLAAAHALARQAVAAAAATGPPLAWAVGGRPALNPTLRILPLSWKGLGPLVAPGDGPAGARAAVRGSELLLVWRSPGKGAVFARAAEPNDLLALKLVAEELDPAAVAAMGPLSQGEIEGLLASAADAGLILAPRPLIRRDEDFPAGEVTDPSFFVSASFTLQWHLTQSCDLHCRHCYDRSERAAIPREAALSVLDDLQAFCRARRVGGAISFSGGNPLLHPHFPEIYAAAAERGFALSILGNPAPRRRVEELLAVRAPRFFQVSLEGLPEHNDWVRGAGHFARTEVFLRELKELGVSTMVMLTLTDRNIDQVLPLAARLRGLVDDFHFNRLAMVGEGARLRLPERGVYERFLERYLEAAAGEPALGLKDNLINVVLRRRGAEPFGGCTGFGCGAAFNFLALLPDGEVHACRKLPSPIGNAVREGLAAVYDSPAARRYRAGCAACSGCPIRPVCGGCLAVAHGHGLDPLRERDPLCFFREV